MGGWVGGKVSRHTGMRSEVIRGARPPHLKYVHRVVLPHRRLHDGGELGHSVAHAWIFGRLFDVAVHLRGQGVVPPDAQWWQQHCAES